MLALQKKTCCPDNPDNYNKINCVDRSRSVSVTKIKIPAGIQTRSPIPYSVALITQMFQLLLVVTKGEFLIFVVIYILTLKSGFSPDTYYRPERCSTVL